MTPPLPENLEIDIIAAKLKMLLDSNSTALPKDFSKNLAAALEPLIEKQENICKETIGLVNTHQEETANTLNKSIAKLTNDQNQIKENLYTNTKQLQHTSGKLSPVLSELLNNAPPTVSNQ